MTFKLTRGRVPLLVSIPHMGTEIPEALRGAYDPRALQVEDTDWHLDRLYAFAHELGASVLQPTVSRYVIDLNRPPDDTPMYPGASNTELCPTRFFTGDPLYAEGSAPSAQVKLQRREQFWAPYHAALRGELDRLKAEHGWVLLWDAHSIRSEIPWLFEGVLPDLNIGTANGAAAHASVGEAVQAAASRAAGVTNILNGRFKGGYITRQYGRPAEHVHAVQLEMTQKTYMRESLPYDYDEAKAAKIQPVVRSMVEAAFEACSKLYG
ncbi:N-formylglutamate deformylase [Ramlibacter humi]|uniref:N-formylglutamate deformylase n=1 Tax=Ramlibacter humi TaxID=2530451 RepID=A0A4Z0BIV0_9BURK|nr:N-formylglutamate deformylase [Ramlibacter humi]TFY98187.1 N-formylglutamate deformylase [Ramlibacter humi]